MATRTPPASKTTRKEPLAASCTAGVAAAANRADRIAAVCERTAAVTSRLASASSAQLTRIVRRADSARSRSALRIPTLPWTCSAESRMRPRTMLTPAAAMLKISMTITNTIQSIHSMSIAAVIAVHSATATSANPRLTTSRSIPASIPTRDTRSPVLCLSNSLIRSRMRWRTKRSRVWSTTPSPVRCRMYLPAVSTTVCAAKIATRVQTICVIGLAAPTASMALPASIG